MMDKPASAPVPSSAPAKVVDFTYERIDVLRATLADAERNHKPTLAEACHAELVARKLRSPGQERRRGDYP